jgi:hypothetical protein
MPNAKQRTIWQVGPDASGDIAEKSAFQEDFQRHAITLNSNILTRTLAKRGRSLLFGSPAPGPGTAARHLGRLPGQPRPQRDLWVPQRRVRPGGMVDG